MPHSHDVERDEAQATEGWRRAMEWMHAVKPPEPEPPFRWWLVMLRHGWQGWVVLIGAAAFVWAYP